jgi:hypothetical protein
MIFLRAGETKDASADISMYDVGILFIVPTAKQILVDWTPLLIRLRPIAEFVQALCDAMRDEVPAAMI